MEQGDTMPFIILLLTMQTISHQLSVTQQPGRYEKPQIESDNRYFEENEAVARHKVIADWLRRYGLSEPVHTQCPDNRINRI
jgi:hypothetical protein